MEACNDAQFWLFAIEYWVGNLDIPFPTHIFHDYVP
jgi:hypothetical protein